MLLVSSQLAPSNRDPKPHPSKKCRNGTYTDCDLSISVHYFNMFVLLKLCNTNFPEISLKFIQKCWLPISVDIIRRNCSLLAY